ncbi:NERD domain-containing protein, partial [Staphylococcus epidermidis]
NNDVSTHAKKNAKREVKEILESFKKNGQLKYYEIIQTSKLATKHPFFEYLRTFDFIVVSDVGLINIDVKNWKQKTFYHFDASVKDELNLSS